MFLNLLDPDSLVTGVDSDRDLLSQSKISKKTLIPTALRLLFDFLSLKNYVNDLQKVISRKLFLN